MWNLSKGCAYGGGEVGCLMEIVVLANVENARFLVFGQAPLCGTGDTK
jgi:hypothetical protein